MNQILEMEIKKIKRIENETSLFCLDDCIATLAGYYQCDYEMMYIGGSKIEVQETMDEFAKNYNVRVLNRIENLKKYHGLNIKKYDSIFNCLLKKKVRGELEKKKPVLLLLNPFWCPWDDGFQKYDAVPGHAFIIQGIYDKGYICIDPYFEKEHLQLPFNYFYRGLQEIYLTEYVPFIEISNLEYKELLKEMFASMHNNGYFHNMKSLVDDIEQNNNIFKGIRSDEEFWISPLAVLLLKLNQSIQNMAAVTNYVAGKCQIKSIEDLGLKLWNLTIKWKQARKLIIKLYFIKREDEKLKNVIIDRMTSIVNELEVSTEELPVETKEELSELINDDIKRNEVMLDLKPFMNNKAFLRKSDLYNGMPDADFSSIGNCYIFDDTKGDDKFVISNNSITLTEVGSDGYDNIACNGQKIAVPNGRYSKIVLIGAAEFGHSSDILKIVLSDFSEFEREFNFTDYICKPYFDEKIVWKGDGIHKLEDGFEWMNEDLYLFEQEISISDIIISEIILPINPSIHIFGIILAATVIEG